METDTLPPKAKKDFNVFMLVIVLIGMSVYVGGCAVFMWALYSFAEMF